MHAGAAAGRASGAARCRLVAGSTAEPTISITFLDKDGAKADVECPSGEQLRAAMMDNKVRMQTKPAFASAAHASAGRADCMVHAVCDVFVMAWLGFKAPTPFAAHCRQGAGSKQAALLHPCSAANACTTCLPWCAGAASRRSVSVHPLRPVSCRLTSTQRGAKSGAVEVSGSAAHAL